MPEVIKYVSSAISLVAFVAWAAVLAYRSTLRRREREIRLAPPDQRAELITAALEAFHVDTTDLPPDQKVAVVTQIIQRTERRNRTTAMVVAWIALLATIVLIFAILQPSAKSESNVSPQQHPSPTLPASKSPERAGDRGLAASLVLHPYLVRISYSEGGAQRPSQPAISVPGFQCRETGTHIDDGPGGGFPDPLRIEVECLGKVVRNGDGIVVVDAAFANLQVQVQGGFDGDLGNYIFNKWISKGNTARIPFKFE